MSSIGLVLNLLTRFRSKPASMTSQREVRLQGPITALTPHSFRAISGALSNSLGSSHILPLRGLTTKRATCNNRQGRGIESRSDRALHRK